MIRLRKRLLTAVLAAVLTGTSFAHGNLSALEAAAAGDEVPEGYTPVYDITGLSSINNDLSGKYILMNDIDLAETAPGGSWDSGHGWTPIGADSGGIFQGVLDGNGNSIKNMHIYGNEYDSVGLFSGIGYPAEIKNLGVKDCDINVEGADRIGGITGICAQMTFSGDDNARLEECFVTGKIMSASERPNKDDICIGGIAGLCYKFDFKNCYNAAMLQAAADEASIGGIIGGADLGDLRDCYSAGQINGLDNQHVGGIIGDSEKSGWGQIGERGIYYLKSSVTGGQDGQNNIGSALAEAQMKQPGIFAGFDFQNQWYIDSAGNYKYPQLQGCPQERITGCTLLSEPVKLKYAAGEELDLTGGVLSLTYENSGQAQIALEKSMISGYDKNQTGVQTITVSYGNTETEFDVLVENVRAKRLQLSPKKINLKKGKKKAIRAVMTPENASDTIKWSSSNKKIAVVDKKGVVTAKKKGTVVITARTSGGLLKKVIITVI